MNEVVIGIAEVRGESESSAVYEEEVQAPSAGHEDAEVEDTHKEGRKCIGNVKTYTDDEMFDFLEELQKKTYQGVELSAVKTSYTAASDDAVHEFELARKEDGSEIGAKLFFGLAKMNRERVERIEDGTIEVGKIGELVLLKHAVDILPMLEIKKANQMDSLVVSCDSFLEIERILERKKKIFVGKIKKSHLVGYGINILVKLEIQEGNKMDVLTIDGCELASAGPFLYSKEVLAIGEIEQLGIGDGVDEETGQKILSKIQAGILPDDKNHGTEGKKDSGNATAKRGGKDVRVYLGLLLCACVVGILCVFYSNKKQTGRSSFSDTE
ncbi:MAG: uncharacterized protein A8A55_0396 [Amphiamblys sp. WSBS2006]|nr:MAG: uncharacterized protein A8A55_0396 [Amphiamblys sp. WSBS2006]